MAWLDHNINTTDRGQLCFVEAQPRAVDYMAGYRCDALVRLSDAEAIISDLQNLVVAENQRKQQLEEQVAKQSAALKLAKERDEWKNDAINGGNAGYLREQLAALAEQNAKMRSFLEFAWKDIPMNEYAFKILEHVMNLPNLATPLLNRLKAEAYREAAMHCSKHGSRTADEVSEDLFANADELEQSK